MMRVFDLCHSEGFLRGNLESVDQFYSYKSGEQWLRRVTPAQQYLDAIANFDKEEDDKRITPWHVLEEDFIDQCLGVIYCVCRIGNGEVVEEVKKSEIELSNLLSTDQRIRDLALEIGKSSSVDGERLLAESLGEHPFGHLRVALWMDELLPSIQIPFVDVLVEAYQKGFMPYGVFNQRLDDDYVGPNLLLCLNPTDLVTVR